MTDEAAAPEPARIEYLSKSEIVEAAIRELIITGEFAPGSTLRQRDLAARFNVSPTPVREALRHLAAEGLVRSDLHRGATVIDTDYEQNEENSRIRAVLESMAAGLAAERITAEQLAEVERLHEQMTRHPEQARELNSRFHFRIYEACHSPLLLALVRLLWQSLPQGPRIGRTIEESIHQHAEILDALRTRDAERAEETTREHILTARPGEQSAMPPRRGSAGRQAASEGNVDDIDHHR